MKLKFCSPGQFLVSLAFFLLALLCAVGSFYNLFHLLNASLCGIMSWGAYKSW